MFSRKKLSSKKYDLLTLFVLCLRDSGATKEKATNSYAYPVGLPHIRPIFYAAAYYPAILADTGARKCLFHAFVYIQATK